MKNLPLVSVVAVCYNHAKYVVETLDSIKNQTYQNIELIIMDDCSTDSSVEVIQQWIDETKFSCQFIAHHKNQGLCKTINEAISNLRGVYVQIISCDDILVENKFQIQVEKFESLSKDYGLIHTDLNYIDDNSLGYKKPKPDLRSSFDGVFYYKLMKGNHIAAPTLLYRLSAIQQVKHFNEAYSFEDLDMLLKLSKKFKIAYLDEVTVNYRILDTSLYRTRSIKGYIDRIKILNDHILDSKSSDLANINILDTSLNFLKKLKKERKWSLYVRFFISSLKYIPDKSSIGFYNYRSYFFKPFLKKIKK